MLLVSVLTASCICCLCVWCVQSSLSSVNWRSLLCLVPREYRRRSVWRSADTSRPRATEVASRTERAERGLYCLAEWCLRSCHKFMVCKCIKTSI